MLLQHHGGVSLGGGGVAGLPVGIGADAAAHQRSVEAGARQASEPARQSCRQTLLWCVVRSERRRFQLLGKKKQKLNKGGGCENQSRKGFAVCVVAVLRLGWPVPNHVRPSVRKDVVSKIRLF